MRVRMWFGLILVLLTIGLIAKEAHAATSTAPGHRIVSDPCDCPPPKRGVVRA